MNTLLDKLDKVLDACEELEKLENEIDTQPYFITFMNNVLEYRNKLEYEIIENDENEIIENDEDEIITGSPVSQKNKIEYETIETGKNDYIVRVKPNSDNEEIKPNSDNEEIKPNSDNEESDNEEIKPKTKSKEILKPKTKSKEIKPKTKSKEIIESDDSELTEQEDVIIPEYVRVLRKTKELNVTESKKIKQGEKKRSITNPVLSFEEELRKSIEDNIKKIIK